ncbi:MAG: Methyl-accepting chemotaxis sensory transducer [Ignavibacteria bacterium]|nr:Methyl-accepting chemotaxis sensory transducer [Ignavibacteria bacterium]
MDFSKAIEVHIMWKRRLTEIVSDKSSEKLDPAVVRADNVCEIGKWIYSDGIKYKGVKEYEDFRTNHANFHKCAASVLNMKLTGNSKVAQTMLEDFNSEYKHATSNTVNAITKLSDYIKQHG